MVIGLRTEGSMAEVVMFTDGSSWQVSQPCVVLVLVLDGAL